MSDPTLRIIMAAVTLVAETMPPYERTEKARRALVPYPMIDELAEALRAAGVKAGQRNRRRNQ